MALKQYSYPATEDPKLLGWYRTLVETGDLKTLFRLDAWPLSAFLQVFQPPAMLFYDETAAGEIWFAMWATPMMSGVVATDLWVAQEHRPTKATLKNVIATLSQIFETQRLVIVMTASEGIAEEHLKFGFTKIGCIPDFIDGQDMHLAQLSRDAFNGVSTRFHSLLTEAHA